MKTQAFFENARLLQYLKVYTASAKDGYRINVKEKQDFAKIEFIRKRLNDGKQASSRTE